MNDGSPDRSLEIAIALADADPHVRVVELSRNFGHHTAMFAGLQHARGNLVFLIDIDLEEQPEWLLDFWADLHETSSDMVYGVQTVRSGSVMKRYTGSLFYRFFNLAADTTNPYQRMHDPAHEEALRGGGYPVHGSSPLHDGFIQLGWIQQRPPVRDQDSPPQKSTYTPIRLIRLSVDAVTSFSSYPLTVVFVAGIRHHAYIACLCVRIDDC